MPGWYLDMMIALQRPYERRRAARMRRRREQATRRILEAQGASCCTTRMDRPSKGAFALITTAEGRRHAHPARPGQVERKS